MRDAVVHHTVLRYTSTDMPARAQPAMPNSVPYRSGVPYGSGVTNPSASVTESIPQRFGANERIKSRSSVPFAPQPRVPGGISGRNDSYSE